MDNYNAMEGATLSLQGGEGEEEEDRKYIVRNFSLHLSRLHLPHTAMSTRKCDNDTTALEIVHFLYALAYRTLIILTEFFPRPRDLLALLRKFMVIEVRILDARREYALDIHIQVVKRRADNVRTGRHLDVPR